MSAKELNIGDYVRTKYGITQYKEYETSNGSKLLCMPVKDGSNGIFANIEDIIKSSPNIRDLIKAGDIARYIYKNKEYISKIIDRGTLMLEITGDMEVSLGLVEIKSIVIKEQFESMEYKIGE